MLTSSVWRGRTQYFLAGLVSGALLTGLLVGAVAGWLEPLPRSWRVALVGTLLVAILAFELAGRPLRLPQNARAVPQTIIDGPWVRAPLQFGFEMGTGLRTFMPTALPHALVLLVLGLGGLGPGLLAGLGFGFGRVLMPVVRSLSPSPRRWDARLEQLLAWTGRGTAVAFAAAATAIVVGG